MTEDQTHNINTFMERWKATKTAGSYLKFSTASPHLEWRVSELAKHASLASQRAFTPDQCAEVIRSWPEYKTALERLGGGE
jgi:hypothetical protein